MVGGIMSAVDTPLPELRYQENPVEILPHRARHSLITRAQTPRRIYTTEHCTANPARSPRQCHISGVDALVTRIPHISKNINHQSCRAPGPI